MAPSVLGVGLPASSSLVPEARRQALKEVLDFMETDMQSSPYDWEMFWVEPDMQFDLLVEKLRERQWDVVLVGVGLRITNQITPFFEKIVNSVHQELPKAKIAFNTTIEGTQEACKRVLDL